MEPVVQELDWMFTKTLETHSQKGRPKLDGVLAASSCRELNRTIKGLRVKLGKAKFVVSPKSVVQRL